MVSTFTRSRRAQASAAGLATILSFAPHAAPHASAQNASQHVTVHQGDRLRINGNSMCTVGFNDIAAGVSLTAAHCGSAGAPVSLVADDGRMIAQNVGTFTPSAHFVAGGNTHTDANDVGTITWNSTVQLGENAFSVNTIVAPADITAQDRVCFHGANTHSGSPSFTCGPVVGLEKDTLFFDAVSSRGDSGGPVWIEGKGFAGVLSGLLIGPEDEFQISYASLGEDGAVSDLNSEVMPLWENYQLAQSDITYNDNSELAPTINRTPYYFHTNEVDVAEQLNNAGSSMGVLAAVIGVLAAVGSLLALAPVLMGAF